MNFFFSNFSFPLFFSFSTKLLTPKLNSFLLHGKRKKTTIFCLSYTNNTNENDGDGSIEDIYVTIIFFFFCKLVEIEVKLVKLGGAKKTSFLSTTRTRTY